MKKEISKLLEVRESVRVVDATLRDGGLVNDFYFTDEFVNDFVLKRPGNKGGALFLIDMDNFKVVNDSLGHLKGDEALKMLAGAMRIVFNGGYLGRYGGDEFIAFMIGCTTDSDMERYASELCHKMRHRMEENGVSKLLSLDLKISFLMIQSRLYLLTLRVLLFTASSYILRMVVRLPQLFFTHTL